MTTTYDLPDTAEALGEALTAMIDDPDHRPGVVLVLAPDGRVSGWYTTDLLSGLTWEAHASE